MVGGRMHVQAQSAAAPATAHNAGLPAPTPRRRCYFELQKAGADGSLQTYWALDHSCSDPSTRYIASPEACMPFCSDPDLAANRYWWAPASAHVAAAMAAWSAGAVQSSPR